MNEASKQVPLVRRTLAQLDHYFNQATGGIALLAVHEADSLRGHYRALRERWAVARRARSTTELIRDQVDLVPETRNRVLRDQDVRRELWRGFLKDLGAKAQRLG